MLRLMSFFLFLLCGFPMKSVWQSAIKRFRKFLLLLIPAWLKKKLWLIMIFFYGAFQQFKQCRKLNFIFNSQFPDVSRSWAEFWISPRNGQEVVGGKERGDLGAENVRLQHPHTCSGFCAISVYGPLSATRTPTGRYMKRFWRKKSWVKNICKEESFLRKTL